MQTERPNILIITTDEERYPPYYEDEALREFRRTQLTGREAIKKNGVSLERHYAASTACAPSRASIYTGHYPTLHGVRATDGAAKTAYDPNMFWLEPYSVPTMGHYFRGAGYRTFYKGKWHVSHADLVTPDTRDSLLSNNDDGSLIEPVYGLYEARNRLSPYGFEGWVGPEPHGTAQANAGVVRDPITMNQLDALFDALDKGDDQTPFLAVASFLNPHDIALFGLPWLVWGYDFQDDTVPRVPKSPTEDESLDQKPSCQADYVKKYGRVFLPQPQIPIYRRFYYYLHKLADQFIQRVYARLQASRFAQSTIVVLTSDHGDMLGAHGGMHQKWYNAYEESIHVPFVISGPGLTPGSTLSLPTSHVDILPTLLGLAGIDGEAVRRDKLAPLFTEAQPLVGRDLSGVLKGGAGAEDPIYFMTEDEVSEGLNQTSVIGLSYEAVEEPAKVEAVVARVDGGKGPKLWKYARSYTVSQIGSAGRRGRDPSEYELYNLEDDPSESTNLAHRGRGDRESRAAREELETILNDQRAKKALHPETINPPRAGRL